MRWAMTILSAFILTASSFAMPGKAIGIRYRDEIFSRVDITKDVIYGENYDFRGQLVKLKMDVYEPHGDDAEKRALIIFIHGGGFTGGDKADKQWVFLCTTFAKRGYVTASINYRLQKPGNVTAHAITQAMHDAKAAVRYFRAHASEWRIDEEKIALVGGSAGAITALHATYLREPEYEGNSGNEGYSSNVSACIDLWGGLYDNVSKIDSGEPPVCIIHGTEDKGVPFSEALNISERCREVGVYCELHPLKGEGHAPWHLIDDFLPWMVNFLYKKMIGLNVKETNEGDKIPFIGLPHFIYVILLMILLRMVRDVY
ncbi:MAG TPA: alpha/beta hydrolase [Thermoplasmatales archaeon]|nr:alpha/beta hydrolase [Thermoplasmatales archaeon]